jgi:arylsulfatase A-like enzyme
MMKRAGLGVLIACLLLSLLTGVFFAIGGREGALLMYVKLTMRQDYPATQEVKWQSGPATSAGTARQPNIIVILADDLGFNDITLYGGGIAGGSVPTPHIDSIAREGVHFPAGYAGNATCSPSRAALMTGRYPTRFGFEFTPVPKQFMKLVGNHSTPGAPHAPVYHAENERDLIAYEDQGLPTSEITIAKLLQGSGYHTVHLGKWHLGDSPQFRPRAHGFSESLSMLHGASMFLPENDPGVINAKQDFDPIDRFLWASSPWAMRFNEAEPFKPGAYMTDYLTDEAIKVVAANRHRPFFMYLAYNAPHTPLQATRDDYDALSHIEDHTTRVYAAMIRSLDRNIGRVLQSLKDQGVDDNTLVIFTSDNGGAHYIGVDGINKPYRGWKATYFDGGTHVPFFMRWPAGVPKGATYPAMVSHFDIFATAAAAAGASLPKDRTIDGANLLPFVRGEATGRPHEQLFWRGGDYRAVRAGDWKLQVTKNPLQDWLYNVGTDPGERTNLAAREPARVAELKAMLAAFNQQQAKPLWPSLAEAPIALDKTLRQPWQKNDAYIYFAN